MVAWLCAASVATAGASVRAGGYVKHFSTALDPPSVAGAGGPLEGAAVSRLRLRLFTRARPDLALELAYEITPRMQPSSVSALSGNLPRPAPFVYRVTDLRDALYPASGEPPGSFSLRHNLDRATITYSTSRADFSLGRQSVAFGSARVVSPVDVLTPFPYQELDQEERVGVDAFRVRIPAGALSEIDLGLVFGEGFETRNSAAFAGVRLHAGATDVTPVFILFRENLLAGLDLARSVGAAGWWLEAGCTLAGLAGDFSADDSYLRLSTGVDYSFGPRLYGLLEYHFSSAGAASASDYLGLSPQTAFSEGAVYLLGEHYLAPVLTFQVSALLNATAQALVNLSDRSALFGPRLEYGFADDVFLEAGAFVGLGAEPTIDSGDRAAAGLRPRSEFGLYPDVYFSSLRIYF